MLTRPQFWLIVAAGGLLTAAGIIGLSQFVAIGIEKGLTPARAAWLLSAAGLAAIAGPILTGILCDRIGGPRGLAIVALAFAVCWLVLLMVSHLTLMLVATIIAGAAAAGIFPCVALMIVQVFGRPAMPKALSLNTLATLPATVLLPLLAAVLRDRTGNYTSVMLSVVLSCGVTALILLWTSRNEPVRKNLVVTTQVT